MKIIAIICWKCGEQYPEDKSACPICCDPKQGTENLGKTNFKQNK